MHIYSLKCSVLLICYLNNQSAFTFFIKYLVYKMSAKQKTNDNFPKPNLTYQNYLICWLKSPETKDFQLTSQKTNQVRKYSHLGSWHGIILTQDHNTDLVHFNYKASHSSIIFFNFLFSTSLLIYICCLWSNSVYCECVSICATLCVYNNMMSSRHRVTVETLLVVYTIKQSGFPWHGFIIIEPIFPN